MNDRPDRKLSDAEKSIRQDRILEALWRLRGLGRLPPGKLAEKLGKPN